MITANQIKAARALIGWRQADLASASGVSEISIKNIERGATDPRTSTLSAVARALEQAGIEFTNGGQPGVRMKKKSPIYEDASQRAALQHAGISIDCPTLGEAVIAYYRLPEATRASATIKVWTGKIGDGEGPLYKADEIERLHHGPKEIQVGDYVTPRDDIFGTDSRHLGRVGQVVETDIRAPFPTHVYVKYSEGDECFYDKGILKIVFMPR
jgi:transcriptional regulator with XRE-family HTH domain